MNIPAFATRRNLLAAMLCIGVVQIACYYLSGTLASSDGNMAIAQPDTLLYCQAARRVAEGHPFSFSEGTAVCTGTTSVLYPFILAVPYLFGATGDSLILAGFVLNAAFYLLFLLGWGLALEVWLEKPGARLLAALLVALAGQPAYCALAQSDIGCWLAVSGLLAAGLARGNRWLYGGLLVLSPWIRPEGMVCVLAFAGIQALQLANCKLKIWDRPDRKAFRIDLLLVAAGLASLVGVFALNTALTGQAQFSSVANKGHFNLHPFAAAVYLSAADFMKMFKEIVLCLPTNLPRDLYSIPFVGGICLLTGVFTHSWRGSPARTASLAVFLLAFFGGFLTVAYSGWQNTNLDRYVCWGVPLLILFTAQGCQFLAEKAGPRSVRGLPQTLFAVFFAGGAIALCMAFNRAANAVDLIRPFARTCEAALPPGASLGGRRLCGLSYLLSPRRFAHTHAIYSPEFATRKTEDAYIMAILKNQPETRFDYWLVDPPQISELFGKRVDDLAGPSIAVGPRGYQIRRADWRGWNREPPAPKGMRLVSKLSVGYEKDEDSLSYEAFDRYGRMPFKPFVQSGLLDGTPTLECGRVLVGGDAMSVPLMPGKDAHVVMRTYPRQTVDTGNGIGHTPEEMEFANPLALRLAVGDQTLGIQTVPYATNGFSDVTFKIPGSALSSSPVRIAFLGDHIACGYWFFQ